MEPGPMEMATSLPKQQKEHMGFKKPLQYMLLYMHVTRLLWSLKGELN